MAERDADARESAARAKGGGRAPPLEAPRSGHIRSSLSWINCFAARLGDHGTRRKIDLRVSADGACHRRQRDRLSERYAGRKVPGLQYVVTDAAGALFQYAGGWADIHNQRAMTPDTTLMAYSMTKTFTAVAILQLVEQGKLRRWTTRSTFICRNPLSRAAHQHPPIARPHRRSSQPDSAALGASGG